MAMDDDEIWGTESGNGGEDPLEPEDIDVLTWRQLASSSARRRWFNRLWVSVCQLRLRYQLPIRSRWWEDEIQVEVLAALASWVQRYDLGDWCDPPGKLSLLFELERIETLLRDGNEPFHPQRDRPGFDRHLELLGWTEPSW